jgi:hypothetical protein
MTDPVQVVAEARGAHRGPFEKGAWRCSCGERFEVPYHTTALYEKHVNEEIIAALGDAGLLVEGEVVGYALTAFDAPDPTDTGGDWWVNSGLVYPTPAQARAASWPFTLTPRVAALHLLPEEPSE